MLIMTFEHGKYKTLHKLHVGYEQEFANCQGVHEHCTMNTLIALTMFHPVHNKRILYDSEHFDYYEDLLQTFIANPFG